MRFMPKSSFIRFLEDYGNIFEISDGSDDEQEEGEITDPEIRARSDIQICLKHSSSSQVCRGNCNNLHICKFKFISNCPSGNCRYGHDLKTDHNRQSLMHHFMQLLEPDQVRILLSGLEHRRGVTIPSICTYYNKINGCKEPVNCPHLHVCAFIAGKCAFQPNCKRSHDLEDEQPKKVLSKFGIEMNAHNKDNLLKMFKFGSLHSSRGQGVSKITHLYSRSVSTVPDKTAKKETKDNQEGSVSEPRSEISKPLRYWNMD
ncbi:protein mono-ADP-ribosyltransferase PARP12-like [Saccostrea cucullata]|uniref:protein mono-ADP-ribosyltransferase PARP12-like n=1 Tax=Saccostrea cuccullata TaxID=36930 RepID=UPI002ED1574C